MKNRAFRAVALAVSLLLALAIPAQAGPVQIGDVAQVVSGSQRSGGQNVTVALRFLAQDDNATAGSSRSGTASAAGTTADGDTSSSGVVTSLQDPSGGAIIQTDVTEDIGVEECECGIFEMPVAGFPKWPFIPLVGLVCLVPDLCTKCTPEQGEDQNCNPVTDCTVTGTCPEVPEPTSLLLFGSGIAALGASLRRRYAQAKEIKDQAATISGS